MEEIEMIGFKANMEEVAAAMSKKSVWNIKKEQIVKLDGNEHWTIYAAYMGDVLFVCKAYDTGEIIVRTESRLF